MVDNSQNVEYIGYKTPLKKLADAVIDLDLTARKLIEQKMLFITSDEDTVIDLIMEKMNAVCELARNAGN